MLSASWLNDAVPACQSTDQIAAYVTADCYNFQHQQLLTGVALRLARNTMGVKLDIENKITSSLAPQHLAVENESHQHSGPATESHFKVTAVSEAFAGQTPVKRHQQIYALLADEMAQGVHALALHLYTPSEWRERELQAPDSPDCLGGSKADQ